MSSLYEIKLDVMECASVPPFIDGKKITEIEPRVYGDWSRSFLVFSTLSDDWKPYIAHVDDSGLPLRDFFGVGASGAVFGCLESTLNNHSHLFELLDISGEMLPFRIEELGDGKIFHCTKKLEDALDMKKSKGQTLANGNFVATKPVFKDGIEVGNCFFRIPEVGTKLFLSYEGDISELFGADNNGLVIAEC